MSINQNSHFRYGTFTSSSLENSDKVPVLATIISSYSQEVFPSNSMDESSIEFEFETDRNLYLDMRDTRCKGCWNKNSSKTVGGGKKKPNRRTRKNFA